MGRATNNKTITKRIENDNKIETKWSEMVACRSQMEINSMLITTMEESTNSILQSTNYTNELGHILVQMVENVRDDWTCGYNCIRMNEKGSNTFGPLICEKDVSGFHMDVQEISHHGLNGVLEKMTI